MKNLTLVLILCIVIAAPQASLSQTKKSSSAKKGKSSAGAGGMNDMIEREMRRMGMSEEELKDMQEAMKTAGALKDLIPATGTAKEMPVMIPPRRDDLLSNMPALRSDADVRAYISMMIADCRRVLPRSTTAAVDDLLKGNTANSNALINIPPVLLANRSITAAVYAALRVAETLPASMLAMNNLGVVLHQSGYAHNALPVLQYIASQQEAPIVLNSIGQAYLTLGDTAQARTFFARTLAMNAMQSEAHCGMGLIEAHGGDPIAAEEHIGSSIKDGYSRFAESIIHARGMQLGLEKIGHKVPGYFNPYKHRPIDHPVKIDEITLRGHQWQSYADAAGPFFDAANALKVELKLEEERLIPRAERDPEAARKLLSRGIGLITGSPLAWKAQAMVNAANADLGKVKQIIGTRSAEANRIHDRLQKALDDFYQSGASTGLPGKDCPRKIAIVEQYLKEGADNYDACVRQSFPLLCDATNQLIYWQRFIVNDQMYRCLWNSHVNAYFEMLGRYKTVFASGWGLETHIERNCSSYSTPDSDSVDVDIQIEDCPVNLKIKAFVASYKLNCKGWEFEAGKLIKFNAEQDFKTGEYTFLLGVSTGVDAGIIDLGAKGQLFVKFDDAFSPVDIGVKGEAGAEVATRGFGVEEKAMATIGLTSGVNVGGVALNREYPIFTWSPVGGN